MVNNNNNIQTVYGRSYKCMACYITCMNYMLLACVKCICVVIIALLKLLRWQMIQLHDGLSSAETHTLSSVASYIDGNSL